MAAWFLFETSKWSRTRGSIRGEPAAINTDTIVALAEETRNETEFMGKGHRVVEVTVTRILLNQGGYFLIDGTRDETLAKIMELENK